MGLISLTWAFCHNFVKIHIEDTGILSFSCSVLLFVKADGDRLAVPNCKKKSKIQNGLMQRLLLYKTGTIPLTDFFQFYTLLFSVRDAILIGLFLINFKRTHCKNHFDTNLVKIH